MQDHLKINHMTKGIIQKLFDLWQVWCPDHLLEKPVPVTFLSEEVNFESREEQWSW